MIFTDDTDSVLQAAVALVNSAGPPDTLTSVKDLAMFFTSHGFTGRHDNDQTELDELRRIRLDIRTLFTASRDDAVDIVNEVLRKHRALPQLMRHDQYDWHLHAIEFDRPFHERVLVETAMAMVDVIRMDEMSRLGNCADDRCKGLVLDLSRNRSRRFCSTTCGNRNAVAAYRGRQGSSR